MRPSSAAAPIPQSVCLPGSHPTRETWEDWANLIRAEYLEMPGLSLNAAQVGRLWNLDSSWTCALLGHLVDDGFLSCTARGTYVRADATCR